MLASDAIPGTSSRACSNIQYNICTKRGERRKVPYQGYSILICQSRFSVTFSRDVTVHDVFSKMTRTLTLTYFDFDDNDKADGLGVGIHGV